MLRAPGSGGFVSGSSIVAGSITASSVVSLGTIQTTSQFLAPMGAAGIPGYAFSGAVSTGFTIAGGIPGFVVNATMMTRLGASSFSSFNDGISDLGTAGIGWKRVYVNKTTSTATVGSVTMNTIAGRINVGTATTTVGVTCNVVSAADTVIAIFTTNDVTGQVKNVIPATGSFTINYTAPAAQATIDYIIISSNNA